MHAKHDILGEHQVQLFRGNTCTMHKFNFNFTPSPSCKIVSSTWASRPKKAYRRYIARAQEHLITCSSHLWAGFDPTRKGQSSERLPIPSSTCIERHSGMAIIGAGIFWTYHNATFRRNSSRPLFRSTSPYLDVQTTSLAPHSAGPLRSCHSPCTSRLEGKLSTSCTVTGPFPNNCFGGHSSL